MNKKIYFLSLFVLLIPEISFGNAFGNVNQFGFDPASFEKANKLDLGIANQIGREVQTGYNVYSYRMESLGTSKQSLTSFEVEIGDKRIQDGGSINPKDVTIDKMGWSGEGFTTPGFRNMPPNFVGSITWFVRRIELAGREASEEERLSPPRNSLRAGEIMNMSFRSKGLPKIQRFWARGWVRPLVENEIVAYARYVTGDSSIWNMDAIPKSVWSSISSPSGYRDAFQGKTLTPSFPPTDPAVICDTFILDLISQVREAASLGWIKHDLRKGDDKGMKKGHDDDGDDHADDDVEMGDDRRDGGNPAKSTDGWEREKDKGLPGAAKSIIKKLTKVRRECMRGKLGNAREKLRALIKQVNAQRGKHLTDEAYFLIKFNAEFLLEKL